MGGDLSFDVTSLLGNLPSAGSEMKPRLRTGLSAGYIAAWPTVNFL
jgi:hypothetical protein